MPASLTTAPVQTTLDRLFADARNPSQRIATHLPSQSNSEMEHYRAKSSEYMAVGRELGKLLYLLTRSINAKNVVEFGTSFGISTIHLAAALRDNAGGKVITTEFIPEKAEKARQNLTDAGLADVVDFRIGDAREKLSGSLPQIDLVFLDGAKGLYIDVLKILEPSLRKGAIIVADNTDHKGIEGYLDYVRDPRSGYTSSAIASTDRASGHEVSIRL